MMKKLFFLFCALMLICIGAWAAEADVDYSYKMSSDSVAFWSGQGTLTAQDWGIEAYAGKSSTFETGKVLYKTIGILPAGTYTVKFYAFAALKERVTCNARTTGDDIATAYVKAGNNSVTKAITIPNAYVTTNPNWEDSTAIELEITLEAGDILEYGIQNVNNGGQWYGIKGLSLVHSGAVSAMTLEEGTVIEDCKAELAHWSFSSEDEDAEMEYNDWSTDSDPSGMSTPFLDYWESPLSAATISHFDILGLPAGYYRVSVDARAFCSSEMNANAITFHVGKNSVDITDGTKVEDGTEYYGTYEIICHLEGTIDSLSNIGFTVSNESACTRLSWKNLKVEYLGESLDYSIGEPQCSAQVAVANGTVAIVYNDCIGALDTDALNLDTTKIITVNGTVVSDTTFTTSGYTATVTFTMPAFSGDSVTISVPEGLIYWNVSNIEDSVKTAGKEISPSGEFTLTTPPFETGGEYLIVNASDGYYFGGGLTWGTTVTELKKPQYIKLEQNTDGTYKLDAHQFLSDNNHYLGVDLYLDSESVDWVIAKSDDGYTIYNASAGGYLTGNGLQQAVTGQTTPSAASYWKFLTYDDVVASMEGASMTNQVDVTALIKAPELKRNSNNAYDGYTAPWTVKAYDNSSDVNNFSFGAGSATANCAESKNSTDGFNVSQEITLPKAGTYLLSAQGFHDGNATDIVLYAGDSIATFPELTTSISSMADAYQAFLREEYTVAAITIEASTDTTNVTIGFKGSNSNEWVVMGELELLYLGEKDKIEWTMTSAGWGTLILPFDADIPIDETTGEATLTLYPGEYISIQDTKLNLPRTDSYIKANTPYIVESNLDETALQNGINYTFTGHSIKGEDSYTAYDVVGTMINMADTDFDHNGNQYLLQNHDGVVAFYKITIDSSVSLNAYHCYLDLGSEDGGGNIEPTSIPAVLSLGRYDETTTGIVAVERDAINETNDAIYDLSGRRVAKAVKGVYIINGKKVLVK